MKVSNWKIPSILRIGRSKELDQYIQGSLASSFVLSENLANWSSNYDPRSRLCLMKFHKEWQSPDCAVRKWYGLQTCQKFKSIQHWRNLDTQFYHEFLIILLADGSACRVERMGEGARTDAIRSTGCIAYDLIQWFSFDDHAAKKWARGSQEMIIQVDFPRAFDLLDVLAVCYSIQHKSHRASVYTLQRYNCYFLCNTILAVLTRHIGNWETMITLEDWPKLVYSMIEDLKHKSLLPINQQEPTDFLALGICSLLDPNSPNPADFLLAPLQAELEQKGRDGVNKQLANTLWYKSTNSAINHGLAQCTRNVPDSVLNDPAPNSATFNLFALLKEVDKERFPPTGLDPDLIRDTMAKELVAVFVKMIQEAVVMFKWELRMRVFENKPRLSQRIAAPILGLLFACLIPPSLLANAGAEAFKAEGDEDAALMRFLDSRFGVTMGHLFAAIPFATRLDMVQMGVLDRSNRTIDRFDSISRLADFSTCVDLGAESLFQVMMKALRPESESPNLLAALAFLNTCLSRVCWDIFFNSCMLKLGKHDFHSIFTRKTSTLQIHRMDGVQMQTSVSTVFDFQTYIQERIQRHAERVESFQLASAPLVQRDIEGSMSEVWVSLKSEILGERDQQPL